MLNIKNSSGWEISHCVILPSDFTINMSTGRTLETEKGTFVVTLITKRLNDEPKIRTTAKDKIMWTRFSFSPSCNEARLLNTNLLTWAFGPHLPVWKSVRGKQRCKSFDAQWRHIWANLGQRSEVRGLTSLLRSSSSSSLWRGFRTCEETSDCLLSTGKKRRWEELRVGRFGVLWPHRRTVFVLPVGRP